MSQPPRSETETAVPPDRDGDRPEGRAEPLPQRPVEDSALSADRSTWDEPPRPEPPSKPTEVTSAPQKIGRYQILRELGRGGFGLVYLAHDTELQRQVAIKVPRLDKRWSDWQLQEYRREAQVLARLDHPHIVRVYDIGQSEQFPVFVVSQCIDGVSLDQLMPELHRQPTFRARVQLLTSMASALEYAHQFVVHRDIKPANVLIRKNDSHVFVADFGLALREEEHGTGMDTMGTSGYASPEQVGGEGHRVDGRSDLYSLGVILYELLVGRIPFPASPGVRGMAAWNEYRNRVSQSDVKPPRQFDPGIPRELERICLKLLERRKSDRYSCARDMLDDLQAFERGAFGGSTADGFTSSGPTIFSPATTLAPTGPLTPISGTSTPVPVRPDSQTPRSTMSDEAVLKIVPKGLRSFDAGDRDFFLDLLPGPRDRAGLPDSIRFWKSRIEAADSRESAAFSVGVLYGPSGCGKSSLVKAGLLTHLSSHVSTVYIEATGTDTESRLVKALRSVVGLPAEASVVDALRIVRQGQGLPAGGKVLLVLDQFEQWLHANRESAVTELARALRQCDGPRLQCLLLVRDDFWLAISRFLRELEVPLLQGENCAMADLFDLPHARRVLGAFGAAFGVLPAFVRDWSAEQRQFVEDSVAALAEEGKVISVRLALFAEMVKSKPWTPATLQEVGGTEGVGVTFLEETFGATTAPMAYRTHQVAVRGVLNALLPDAGTDIKGHMIPREQLLEASGYRNRSHDFDALLRILDHDLRMITPVDAEGQGLRGEGQGKEHEPISSIAVPLAPQPSRLSPAYQLAHDYLVPSIREWLHKKQKETRRGRAELRLSERAAQWNSQPQNRYLPAWWEDLSIRLLTKRKNWTERQRRLMRRSGVFHGLRLSVLLIAVTALIVGGVRLNQQIRQQRRADFAAALVQNLLVADTEKVPAIVKELSEFRSDTDPLLHAALENGGASEADLKRQLHASLALLPVDDSQVSLLLGRMLATDPATLPVIRNALQIHRSDLIPKLWPIVHDATADGDRRFRAAAALANFDPPSGSNHSEWPKSADFVAEHLLETVKKNPSNYGVVIDSLRPARAHLLTPLANVFRDAKRTAGDHERVTTVLIDFGKEQPDLLADLLCDANPPRFKAIFDSLQQSSEGLALAVRFWKAEIAKPQPQSTDQMQESLAIRQSRAAVALVRSSSGDEVWPLLRYAPDSRRRSNLVHSFQALCDPRILWERYQQEPDVTVRRALLLALGEWALPGIPPADPQTPEAPAGSPPPFSAEDAAAMSEALLATYRADSDVGLHGAAAWLLRQWGHKQKLLAIDQELAVKTADQLRVTTDKPTWSVNGQGQTMIRIPGSVEFTMGSPASEPDRFEDREAQVPKRIGRTFEISAYEVTVEQFSRFRKEHRFDRKYARESDAPANVVKWYDAAAYCNWLSEQEGISREQWCYDPDQKFDEGMTLPPDYLSRKGYRLPTEAEWEYACRAGTTTARYYGETDALLDRYAWYANNSRTRLMLPIGSLKPNDLGLFDMLGNVFEWPQESMSPTAKYDPGEDREDPRVVTNKLNRAMRGGSFFYLSLVVRSAYRIGYQPSFQSFNFGFRVARTRDDR